MAPVAGLTTVRAKCARFGSVIRFKQRFTNRAYIGVNCNVETKKKITAERWFVHKQTNDIQFLEKFSIPFVQNTAGKFLLGSQQYKSVKRYDKGKVK